MAKVVDPLTCWPVGQEGSGVGVAKRAAPAISGRDASPMHPLRLLLPPPVDDCFTLLEAAEHIPENLVVLTTDAHRFDHLGFKVFQ